MYAIIQTGSKQYKVKKNDVINVELLEAEVGAPVEFSQVLFVQDETGKATIGTPIAREYVVKGQFVRLAKGPKITSVKYKRRKNEYRKFGHRQQYSQVKITDIVRS
jgi:large subunit ribosomal protein L21